MTTYSLSAAHQIVQSALGHEITPEQAARVARNFGLTVEDPKPEPGWYFTDDGTVARVRANKHTGKPMLYVDDGSDRVRLRDEEWPALTPAYVVPVEEWQAITCKAQEQEQAIRDLRKARDEWEEAAYSSRRETDALANRLASTRVVPAEPAENSSDCVGAHMAWLREQENPNEAGTYRGFRAGWLAALAQYGGTR